MSTIFADKFKNTSGGNNVKINQLSGIDTAGSINVTGEGGSNTTNLQQGLVKNWLRYNGATNTINDSLNCASVTDNATGTFTNNYTNNMGNANYSFGEMAGYDTSGGDTEYARGLVTLDLDDITTSSMKVYSNFASASNNGINDAHMIAHQIFGDLA